MYVPLILGLSADIFPLCSAPMLVLWGKLDNFTPSDGPVGRFFQALPSERSSTSFVLMEGLGHCLNDEAPELVHKELLPWLQQVH